MAPGDNATMLRLAGVHKDSIVDGPGIRFSIYVQGCPHGCPGCHNPETHDPRGGYVMKVKDLAALVGSYRDDIDGVTISGGEPFEQAGPLAALVGRVLEEGLNLVIYSGYVFEELLLKSAIDSDVRCLLESGWLLVDGPYLREEQDLNLAFRGSRNQRLIDLKASLKDQLAVEWTGSCLQQR